MKPHGNGSKRVSNPSREFTPLQPRGNAAGRRVRLRVSNPSREFTPLQLGAEALAATSRAHVSNPSREFTPLQPPTSTPLPTATTEFQTPRGNSLLCNVLVTTFPYVMGSSFKPLAGIHSSATPWDGNADRDVKAVSNPSREFTPLQL